MGVIVSHGNSPHEIHSGQTETDDIVVSGGELVVAAGGTAIDLTVSSGGSAIVRTGGNMVVTTGGSSEIDGLLVNQATVTVASNGTLTVDGRVNNTGKLYASGAGSLIDVNGVVAGGIAEVGDGVVEFAGSSSENVSFLANGTGGLVLEGTGNAYKGRISGFGAVGNGNPNQFIDFAGVDFAGASVNYTPANAADTSGTLTVTDGAHAASVTLVGHYEALDFQTANNGGTLEITDGTTISPGAVTNGVGKTLLVSGTNLIVLSSLTNSGTVFAEAGGDITVEGAVTNGLFGVLDTFFPYPASEINLESTVTNSGNVIAVTGDITIQGAFTNLGFLEATYNAAIDLGSTVVNSAAIQTYLYAALTQAGGNVSNTGDIFSYGNSLIALGGFTAAAPTSTSLSNRGLIDAFDQSTITMSFGSGITNVGRIEADSQAYVAIGGSSSLINNGTVAAENSGIVQVGIPAVNYGTMVASGGTINLAQPLANHGALLLEGTGAILANNVTGGVAELDGTGNVNSATGVITGAIDTIALGYSNTGASFGAGDQGVLALTAVTSSSPTAFTGDIEGFTLGDAIDLPNLPFSASDSVTFTANGNGNGGQLTINNGVINVAVLNLVGYDPNAGGAGVSGSYLTQNFHINPDADGDIIITDSPTDPPSGARFGSASENAPSLTYAAGASNVALLGSYMASMFASVEGGVSVPSTEPTAQSQTVVTHPHT